MATVRVSGGVWVTGELLYQVVFCRAEFRYMVKVDSLYITHHHGVLGDYRVGFP